MYAADDTAFTDYRVADLGLAGWGRKEIAIGYSSDVLLHRPVLKMGMMKIPSSDR